MLFTLFASDLVPTLLGISYPWDTPIRMARLNILPQRIFGSVMDNYTLVAVPFFIFMGVMLEKSGLAEELLKTMGRLFGALRGGMAISVVVVGALLAASTGVVGASVVTMAVLALPVMLKYGYDKAFASGVVVSSGTLGQIIPPSIVLIILADQMGISVGDLFLGAFIPGLLLAFMYILWVVWVAWRHPAAAPAMPVDERPEWGRELAMLVVRSLIPPLALVFVVLGTIFFGIASATEAGAAGALGALILAAINRRLNMGNLRAAMDQTVRLTSMVFMILVAATVFIMVFNALRGPRIVEELLLNLPGGEWGFLFFVMLTIFALGFFLDFIEISFIAVPLVVPIALSFGLDPLWLGVLIALNLQASFLTPPFGFSLFYLKGVAPPGVTTWHIYRGVVPFILIQLLALTLVITFPQLALWLPGMSMTP
ncbi:TRAP transporter large permease subunit [Alkalilimnicola ehrlichii]|uniref:TRAP transporter large permease n=1 Tax=Alkalilimnicola ehrlichii TaxID=351052 RepID=UPI002698F917|nr:TRAP transporter large permease subunit [Alkalilimnicola ehrlichii]